MAYDPTIPFWPRALGPRSAEISILNGAVSGPQPTAGVAQTAQSSLGSLQVALSDVSLHDAAPITAFGNYDKLRVFRALYYGRLAHGLPVYMPFWDWVRSPRRRAGLPLFGPLTPHDDGAGFSDGGFYTQGTGDAALAFPAAAGDRMIVIDATSAAVPEAGDFIGLDDRAYPVTGAWPDDAIANRWSLALGLPLRAAHEAGVFLEIADPFCKMVLAPADRPRSVSVDFNRYGRRSLTFLEANWS